MYDLLSEGNKSLLPIIHQQSFVNCLVAQVFLLDSTFTSSIINLKIFTIPIKAHSH